MLSPRFSFTCHTDIHCCCQDRDDVDHGSDDHETDDDGDGDENDDAYDNAKEGGPYADL